MKKYNRQILLITLLTVVLAAGAAIGIGLREREDPGEEGLAYASYSDETDSIAASDSEEVREQSFEEKSGEALPEEELSEETETEEPDIQEPAAESTEASPENSEEGCTEASDFEAQGSEEQQSEQCSVNREESTEELPEEDQNPKDSEAESSVSAEQSEVQISDPLFSSAAQSEEHREPEPVETVEHLHFFEKIYWYGEPSCQIRTNYYNLVCRDCGAYGGDGEDVIDHTPVRKEEVSYEGCIIYRIVEVTCESCGADLGRETECIGEQHQWVNGEGNTVWSEELQDFVTPTITYCEKCYQQK